MNIANMHTCRTIAHNSCFFFMKLKLLSLPCLALLLLTSCKTEAASEIFNSAGRKVGSIVIDGPHEAHFVGSQEEERGKVRGNIIRDAGGKKLGSITEREGKVFIADGEGTDIGTLEDGFECYGKSQESLGEVKGVTDTGIAAAACLTFFLQ